MWLAAALLFAATAALAWHSGTFHSEFGRYADEGMHFVTGLLVQDFLTSGQWSHPMAFALNYYLHFPKVALGNWPPGFSLMQSAWSLVFGVSRTSELWGMILLTAWLAWLVYREAQSHFGTAIAAAVSLMLIAAPLTQSHTAMVMAEVPLAAVSFLALLALIRFVNAPTARSATALALWTVAAIMIKGNGWVIVLTAPLVLLAARRVRLFLSPQLWLAAGIMAVPCVPYTLFTMKIVSQGWNSRAFPGFAHLWESLGIHFGFIVAVFGTLVSLIAFAGLLRQLVPALRRGEANTYWVAMAVYATAVLVFHAAIPSSIEQRKIYQVVPPLCLFVAAGLDAIANLVPLRFARTAVAGAVGVLFFFTGYASLPPYEPGYAPAVEALIARSDTRGAAVLIASNPVWVDSEAAFVAEWASRDRNRGVYLVRASKLLSHAVVGREEAEYLPNFTSEAEVRAALDAVPIAYVILHTTNAEHSYAHHELLRATLNHDRVDWEPVYHSHRQLAALGQTHDIEIYRSTRPFEGKPIRYTADLTNKLGVQASTDK